MTRACLAAGMKAASALDILYQSYGRAWDFSKHDHQADAAYLIAFVFKPKVIHLGLQCKDYCALGKSQPSQESEARVVFSALCALHQEDCDLGVSIENPWASDLWRHPVLNSYLDLETQGTPWAVVKSAACQYGMSFPGTDLDVEGMPLRGQPSRRPADG